MQKGNTKSSGGNNLLLPSRLGERVGENLGYEIVAEMSRTFSPFATFALPIMHFVSFGTTVTTGRNYKIKFFLQLYG